eukprot:6264100-Amphidinium_carterae.1
MSPLVCQLSSQVRSVMMRLALLASPPTLPPTGAVPLSGGENAWMNQSQGAGRGGACRVPVVVPLPCRGGRLAH